MKSDKDQNELSKNVCVINETPGIVQQREFEAQALICDECGDTLWDQVLEQETETRK